MDVFEYGALSALLLAAVAVVVFGAAKLAEKRNPPLGRFLNVEEVKVHYVDRGEGPAIIWIHGNVSMFQDVLTSGIVELLTRRFRVIAFDRPGYGYSQRPRGKRWGAPEQADLLSAAMQQLGIVSAVIVGHSWGTLVAAALAQRYPARVRALVLLSGYFFPKFRIDVLSVKPLAWPILGDVLRYTFAPVFGLLVMPLMLRAMFGPPPIPQRFKREFPISMLLRPWQIRASAADGAMMNDEVEALQHRYNQMPMNTYVLAGGSDRIVSPKAHSEVFARELLNCSIDVIPSVGHMVHHSALARTAAAIEKVWAEEANRQKKVARQSGAAP